MKKNVLAISTLVVLGLVFGIGYYLNFNIEQTNANPDFICIKSVTGESCRISSCTDWGTDGKRTCSGKITTEVGYYHTRTTCDSGYSKSSIQGTTTESSTAANYMIDNGEGDKLYNNYTDWSSGRHSSDFIYNEDDCSIVEVDNIAPTGVIESTGTSIN